MKYNYLKSSNKKKISLTKLLFFLFTLMVSLSSYSQYYKQHYVAPAPWRYFTNANELVVATESTTAVSVAVKKSDGTLVATLSAIKGTPAVYRFSGGATAVGSEYYVTNTVISAAGLNISASVPVSVNVRNVASDQTGGDGTHIKGNASLTSFGDAGVGVSFRIGYYRDGDLGNFGSFGFGKPIYAIMAINNNTSVKINGVTTATLNAGQSYLFEGAIGTLVETSGPAVVNTSAKIDTPSGCGDGTIDQVPPISVLGKEYIIVKGRGNSTAEQTTIVATEANTVVKIQQYKQDGTLNVAEFSVTLAAAGDFYTYNHGTTTVAASNTTITVDAYSSSRILSDKNVAVYSGTAITCEVDITSVAPVSACGGSNYVETYKFRNFAKSDLPYFGYVLLNSATESVKVNGANIETSVGNRRQLGTSGWYLITFSNTQISSPNNITIESASKMTVGLVQQGGGFSMAAIFSSYTLIPDAPTVTPLTASTACANEANLKTDPDFGPYQWFFDGAAISGATTNTYKATKSGNYSVSSTLSCGASVQSSTIAVNICSDVAVSKSVNISSPCVDTNVVFTITAKNNGPGNATGVSVIDALPSGYTYVSSTVDVGTYTNTSGNWSIGSLSDNATAVLKITAKVNASGEYKNEAKISASSDSDLTNNLASVTTTPNPTSKIVLTSSAVTQNQTVCSGTAITNTVYTFGGSATSAVVTNLPAGLSSNVNTTAKTITISGTPTASGTYTITTSGHTTPCIAATISGAVTVNTTPTVPTLSPAVHPSCTTATGSFTITNYVEANTYTVSPSNGVTRSGSIVTAPSGTYTVTATSSSCTSSASSSIEILPNPKTTLDTDGDGISDICDEDDDNDGILDINELNCPSGFIDLGQTFNNSTANPGTVNNVYNYGDVTGTFKYELLGGATWNSGINSQSSSNVTGSYINLQARDTDFPTNKVAVYTLTFSKPIYNLNFKLSGLDNNDRADFTANNSGVNVPVSISNINLTNGDFVGQSINSSNSGANAPANSVAVNSTGPINQIIITTAKNGGNSADITLQINELSYCIAIDSDGDGVPNHLELDSDNDGCSDANEYYNSSTADGGDGGVYGTGTPVVNTSGTVNGASYSGSYTNVTAAGSASTIATSGQPTNQTASSTFTAAFTVTATGGSGTTQYQWQVDSGSGFVNVTNGTIYSNATTATLNLENITCDMNGYKYRVIVSQSNYICGNVTSSSATLTVLNNTTTAASTTPTLCINTALTAITHTTTGATGIGTATGLPAGVTASFASNKITISGTPTVAGTFDYSIPLTGGCGTVNATGKITVTADNTTTAASTTPTLCINTVLTAITHTTTGATGIGTATGLPAGVTASFASNKITISGTPTVAGTFDYTIPLTGGCGTVNATGKITVTADNTTTAASTSPTLCINTALTAITHTTTGATGIGTATGLPAGVTASFASNKITISGTPTVAGTFDYTIPLTGGCGTVNATGKITVTADNTTTAASTSPTLCINTALTAITHTTTGATGIGTATGLPAGVTASFASNKITISGTPTVAGTFDYTIPLTGGCGTVNATGKITVTADNTTTAASTTPTLCINTALTAITHTTTGATGIGTATGLPAGVTAKFDSNKITISGTPTVAGTFDYTIPLTAGCGTVNATGKITVTADNTTTAASTTPTLCINTALTAITHTTTGATGIGTATGLPAGVTASFASNKITISGTPTVAGTFDYSIPLTGGCGTVNATGKITVTADNTTTAASTTPTLCINTALTAITHTTTGATGIGTATGLPAGVTASFTSNKITISGTPTVAGTFDYTIPLTGGCGTVNAIGKITVTADNTTTVASTTPTLCINTALTAITHTTTGATGIGTATGLPAGVTASFASNKITISGTPTVAGIFDYTIPLTGGCGTVNATGKITVTADNTTTAASTTPTLCINTVLTAITHTTTGATGIGTATGLPAGVTASFTSNKITISGTPTVAGTFDYSIPLTGGCGSVNATGKITVNQLPDAPIISELIQPTCSVATGSVKLSGLPSGNWTITPGNYTGNTSDYTITGLNAGKYKFTVTNSLGCISNESVEVIINARPTAPAAPIATISVQPKCGTITGTVIITSAGTGFEYNVDGGNYQSTTTFSNLTPGTHKFTVRNTKDNTCVSNETTVVLNNYICAEDDKGTDINGLNGGTTVANVLVNDELNGKAVVAADVTTTFVSSTNAGVTLDGTSVKVAPGTPAGEYTLVYQICEVLNTTNCDSATVTVKVTAAKIDAVDDKGADINGLNGGTTVANVLVNDELNGKAVVAADVTTTFVSSTNAGVTLDGTSVKVAPGTPAGEYTLVYQICEVLNTTNCDSATVTVKVTAAKIDAVDDKGADINGLN
ncbi:hypothetical protein HNQ02_003545, partial [Flavobacterium sp. 7E]|uniref:DUF11 domain-containing protein n=1 Tax=Flavobacterium sp. 7E TaxID=2735898 RepID=UPI001570DCC1